MAWSSEVMDVTYFINVTFPLQLGGLDRSRVFLRVVLVLFFFFQAPEPPTPLLRSWENPSRDPTRIEVHERMFRPCIYIMVRKNRRSVKSLHWPGCTTFKAFSCAFGVLTLLFQVLGAGFGSALTRTVLACGDNVIDILLSSINQMKLRVLGLDVSAPFAGNQATDRYCYQSLGRTSPKYKHFRTV